MTAGRSRSESLCLGIRIHTPCIAAELEMRPSPVGMGSCPGRHGSRYVGRENVYSLGPMAHRVFGSPLGAAPAKHMQPLLHPPRPVLFPRESPFSVGISLFYGLAEQVTFPPWPQSYNQ